MNYQAISNRCAIIPDLHLPEPRSKAMATLQQLCCQVMHTDVVARAQRQIGCSMYRKGAHPIEAPEVLDCASFARWVYSSAGIRLPRYVMRQMAVGEQIGEKVTKGDQFAGDVIFTSRKNPTEKEKNDPNNVAHVAMFDTVETVVHASVEAGTVVRQELGIFLKDRKWRGIYRFLRDDMWVLQFPDDVVIESSLDIRCLIKAHSD